MNRDRARLPDSDGDYDTADDLQKSVEFAYQAVRARVARGGRGWRGWPEPQTQPPTSGALPRMVPLVTNGTCSGFLVRVAGGVEAYGADEKLVGIFADPISAAVAIENASDATGKGRHVLGVDPGVRGGLAIVAVNDGIAPQIVDAIDIPVVGEGAKERVDAIAIREWIASHKPVHAYIERAQAMPGQGASSGFKYGRAVGSIEAAIALSGIPLTIVEPSAWKKFHKLHGGDKEGDRQRALQLFPTAHALLARRKDHGRADACLLALYGAQR